MSFSIMWTGRERLIKETKVQLIDHILNALCKCELTDKGRKYLIKLKNDINGTQDKIIGNR